MIRVQRNIVYLILLFVLTFTSVLFAQNKLVFAVTLIRHGDRTPCDAIKSSPYDWKVGLGELTPHGMNQEYILGYNLRDRYIYNYHLLPPKYQNNSVFVRSTDFNRTLMSVESLLAGLYPLGTGPVLNNGGPALPAAFQPIPVRSLPKSQDYLLLAKDNRIKQFEEMGDKYVFTTDEWKKKNSSYSGEFDRWSNIFGKKINNLRDLTSIGDNLNVRMLNDVPLPKGITNKEAEKIIELSQWAQAQQFKPQKIGRFIAKEFLAELVDNMQKVVEDKQQYKYIIYSGHDSTILPVMSALGIPLDKTPPYASNLSFELFKDNNNYFVNVRFNGKDINLPCAGKNKRCSYTEFKKLALGTG